MLELPGTALASVQLASAYVIFLASYLVFAIGKFPGLKINRPGAAMIGAVAMIASGAVSAGDALHFIDFPTLVLLFSMMLIVGNLRLVGFFDWNAELLLGRLNPSRLLPAVIFTTGFLSAVFVNDIVCLVMVPFVLTVSKRMRVGPLPHLLAVATSSNIGSVATITGNPQNMLIGSFSRISYRDFFLRLGPVAIVGLFLNWAVLYWLHMRRPGALVRAQAKASLPALDPSSFRKPVVVVSVVVIGFFAGVPPAMMAALGAAALLITRTLDPKKLYDEVDWGLLVFFIGLFLIVGGAENAGIVGKLLAFAEHWNLQSLPLSFLPSTLSATW
jgi:Na+/H+ antiporter NhaD/arsenite permease-like protein